MTTIRNITIYQDGDILAAAAADLFRAESSAAIAARGRFVIALAGGSTPEKLYTLLAKPESAGKIAWDKIFCFFGDERFVPPDDERSNFGMANRTLLSHVPIPASNVFSVTTNLPTAAESASDYEARIAAFFGVAPPDSPPNFDLVLLGLGDDGHTASLFPGKPSLTVRDHWTVATPPGVLPPPVDRITLTFPILNAARQIAFLVSGPKKAEIVQKVIESDARLYDHPAAVIMPVQGKLTWMLDKDAAAKLEP